MTPLLAALSRVRFASRASAVAAAVSPASAASRNLRTAVFTADLTSLLRSRAFSLVLMRFSCDLMFATVPRLLGRSGVSPGFRVGVSCWGFVLGVLVGGSCSGQVWIRWP